MMLSEELNSALNEQVGKEFSNMLFYIQLESFFENLQLKNLAGYFKKQSEHEAEHARKFISYINSRTGGIYIPSSGISNSGVEIGTDTLGAMYVEREEDTTESIEALYQLALDGNSFMDLPFISSMLSEQVEEEDSANEFSQKFNSVKNLVLFDSMFKE